jgi:hypothetical protein
MMMIMMMMMMMTAGRRETPEIAVVGEVLYHLTSQALPLVLRWWAPVPAFAAMHIRPARTFQWESIIHSCCMIDNRA